jgi:hypothetical protein
MGAWGWEGRLYAAQYTGEDSVSIYGKISDAPEEGPFWELMTDWQAPPAESEDGVPYGWQWQQDMRASPDGSKAVCCMYGAEVHLDMTKLAAPEEKFTFTVVPEEELFRLEITQEKVLWREGWSFTDESGTFPYCTVLSSEIIQQIGTGAWIPQHGMRVGARDPNDRIYPAPGIFTGPPEGHGDMISETPWDEWLDFYGIDVDALDYRFECETVREYESGLRIYWGQRPVPAVYEGWQKICLWMGEDLIGIDYDKDGEIVRAKQIGDVKKEGDFRSTTRSRPFLTPAGVIRENDSAGVSWNNAIRWSDPLSHAMTASLEAWTESWVLPVSHSGGIEWNWNIKGRELAGFRSGVTRRDSWLNLYDTGIGAAHLWSFEGCVGFDCLTRWQFLLDWDGRQVDDDIADPEWEVPENQSKGMVALSPEGDVMMISHVLRYGYGGWDQHDARIYRSWKNTAEDDRPADVEFDALIRAVGGGGVYGWSDPDPRRDFFVRVRPARFQPSMIQEP